MHLLVLISPLLLFEIFIFFRQRGNDNFFVSDVNGFIFKLVNFQITDTARTTARSQAWAIRRTSPTTHLFRVEQPAAAAAVGPVVVPDSRAVTWPRPLFATSTATPTITLTIQSLGSYGPCPSTITSSPWSSSHLPKVRRTRSENLRGRKVEDRPHPHTNEVNISLNVNVDCCLQ